MTSYFLFVTNAHVPPPVKREFHSQKCGISGHYSYSKKYFSKKKITVASLPVTLAYHYRQKLNHFSRKLFRRFVSRTAYGDT